MYGYALAGTVRESCMQTDPKWFPGIKAFTLFARQRPSFHNQLQCVCEPGNNRPIAIVSSFSKVSEKLVYDKLASFLEKQSILFEFQVGFRKGHSTEQAILETIYRQF